MREGEKKKRERVKGRVKLCFRLANRLIAIDDRIKATYNAIFAMKLGLENPSR